MRYIKPVHSLLLLTLLLCNGVVLGQADFKRDLEEANRLMEEKFYNQAISILQTLVVDQPDNANVNYKIGEAYLKSSYDRSQALPYLEKAVENITKRYDPFDLGLKQAPIEARFLLGQAYHLNYKLDEAIAQYNLFSTEANKKHSLIPEAQRQITICQQAKDILANPTELEIVKLKGFLNSDEADFAPVISVDEGQIFFTSRRTRSDSSNAKVFDPIAGKHFEDIYVSYKDEDGAWGEPELFQYSRTTSHDATINVSADGQTLFIYRDEEGNGNIYFSKLLGETWTSPEKLGSDINTKYWETHATISADGNTLYFVSDRKGGLGGRDIYRCVKLPTGEWSKALNLGAPINTEYDEDSPYLHPDGRTLYFASNGHQTMGGFDIFTSFQGDDGQWTTPQNVGYPINTVDDDVFFVTSADGKRGYYSSIQADGKGEKDIYMIAFPDDPNKPGPCLAVIKGKIGTFPGSKIPESTTIYMTDEVSGERTLYRPRLRDGVFVAIVQPCKNYFIEYTINDSTVYSENLSIPCNSCYIEINKELQMKTVVLGNDSVVVLDTVVPPIDTAQNILAKALQFQLRYKELPYDKSAVVAYLGEDGLIKFSEKVGSQGTFKYHEIPGIQEYIFTLEIPDSVPCEDMEIVLMGEDGKFRGDSRYKGSCKFVFRKDGFMVDTKDSISSAKIIPATFKKSYKYNVIDIETETRWNNFVKKAADILKTKGSVDVTIEGSASRVPTKTWKTNKNLAERRTADGKTKLIEALAAMNLDTSKVNFVKVKSLVQGPAYSTGDIRPVAEYERYQYIKIDVR